MNPRRPSLANHMIEIPKFFMRKSHIYDSSYIYSEKVTKVDEITLHFLDYLL